MRRTSVENLTVGTQYLKRCLLVTDSAFGAHRFVKELRLKALVPCLRHIA